MIRGYRAESQQLGKPGDHPRPKKKKKKEFLDDQLIV